MLKIMMLPPVKGGQEEFRRVARITVNCEVVLTSEQLSNFYGTDVKIISQNFIRNKEHFEEGQHYFKLEGEDLKAFKGVLQNEEYLVNKFANTIYLWTHRGILRHCKMLNTEKAWKVFEKMEYTFFLFVEGDFAKLTKELRKEYEHLEAMWLNLRSERMRLEQERFNLEEARRNLTEAIEDKNIAKAKVLNTLANSTTNEDLRDDFLKQAAKLLEYPNS